MFRLKSIVILCLLTIYYVDGIKYIPDWKSLDTRPLPKWYDDAKFGIFIHWGVFSVPSFGSEWFWMYLQQKRPDFVDFMKQRYKPGFTYQDFARDFTAEFYNASQWTELFEASGAKYVVLTSKHHEGYTLWPSKYSFSWNSMDVGPHRDLVGELSETVKKNTNLKFGLYHSLFEFFNPLWWVDKENNFSSNTFVTSKIMPEMKELVETYRPEILWSDGDADAPDAYWQSREFITWLYNESPVKDTVVTNDRWGRNTGCKHGDFYSCADRYNPGVLQSHKWENCMTIDRKSWGYRRNAVLDDYMSLEELIKELVTTVSCGGNLLMNIGPTKDGLIPPIFEERLRGIGKWLEINGQAIYKSKPWIFQNDTLTKDVWFTRGENENLYATLLSWPEDNVLKLATLKIDNPKMKVMMLGSSGSWLNWENKADYLAIELPLLEHKGRPAWVVRFVE